ncbi:MAG: hypothetical protein U0231_14060 [Nitrospiraceae bacterium]
MLPNAFAFGAGAERVVEREEQGAQGLERPTAALASEAGTVGKTAAVHDVDQADSICFLEGDFDGLNQTMAIVRPQHEPVQDHLQPVRTIAGEYRLILQIQDLAAAAHGRSRVSGVTRSATDRVRGPRS